MSKKKKLSILLILLCIITFVISAPIYAVEANVSAECVLIEVVPPNETITETEQIGIYLRSCPLCQRVQWRVWSYTFGRWNTEWAYL
jgi:hypothetical protein